MKFGLILYRFYDFVFDRWTCSVLYEIFTGRDSVLFVYIKKNKFNGKVKFKVKEIKSKD